METTITEHDLLGEIRIALLTKIKRYIENDDVEKAYKYTNILQTLTLL